jgi:hypothetical protein
MLIKRNEHLEENGDIGYIESIFKSDNILKSLYFPKLEMLYLSFKRGHTYSYLNISNSFYNEFENAESQGLFFSKKIYKNKEYETRREFLLNNSELTEYNKIIENFEKDENN